MWVVSLFFGSITACCREQDNFYICGNCGTVKSSDISKRHIDLFYITLNLKIIKSPKKVLLFFTIYTNLSRPYTTFFFIPSFTFCKLQPSRKPINCHFEPSVIHEMIFHTQLFLLKSSRRIIYNIGNNNNNNL